MHQSQKLFLPLLLVGGTFVVGCESPATAPTTSQVAGTLKSDQQVALYGPDSITQTGNYTYEAQLLLPYASFQWRVRTCTPTCTGWTPQTGTMVNDFTSDLTEHLTLTCGGIPSHNHFDVMAIGSAFGFPPDTATKTTLLCGQLP
ncbi:MAG TPA: hypothetical protein VJS20_02915 [Gemmatimonadales bacterium]|nr:hypothetical protein [Gemmatimonadales bacterium]